MDIKEITIPDYIFDGQSNPYEFNKKSPKSLQTIADGIESAIVQKFGSNGIIIRGVQSGHHKNMSREELINSIIKNGTDSFGSKGENNIIYAAPFENGIVRKLLEGFHTYKPKCEERPQYPVDIWMVFNKSSYNNVEYMHPRHKVIAKDRWKIKSNQKSVLKALIIVN